MSYELKALIGGLDLLNVVAAEVPAARVARLEQGLALIPMTESLYEALDQPPGAPEPDLGLDLPGGFTRRLAAWSQAGPLAYVEADYFGGVGIQHSAVWENGRLALGPLHKGTRERLADGTPISQALRRLGAARTGTASDEFDAVGLGRHREVGRWSNH